ncbi:P100 [Symbiodinium sp. KB8]|nr:P100 [Symbiodinium sp. KB8]
MLLLHLMPGSRHHGVLASLLHILAQNPAICEAMPLLTKPKKVRLVGQWKLKLTEIHQFVVQAADAMRLNWPPSPESFQDQLRALGSGVLGF